MALTLTSGFDHYTLRTTLHGLTLVEQEPDEYTQTSSGLWIPVAPAGAQLWSTTSFYAPARGNLAATLQNMQHALFDSFYGGRAPEEDEQEAERRRKADEARATVQPDEWITRYYESFTGLRYRCCGNLFGEEHSPWCAVVRDELGR